MQGANGVKGFGRGRVGVNWERTEASWAVESIRTGLVGSGHLGWDTDPRHALRLAAANWDELDRCLVESLASTTLPRADGFDFDDVRVQRVLLRRLMSRGRAFLAASSASALAELLGIRGEDFLRSESWRSKSAFELAARAAEELDGSVDLTLPLGELDSTPMASDEGVARPTMRSQPGLGDEVLRVNNDEVGVHAALRQGSQVLDALPSWLPTRSTLALGDVRRLAHGAKDSSLGALIGGALAQRVRGSKP